MISHNLDTDYRRYLNEEIRITIKYLLSDKSKEYSKYQKSHFIGDLIQHISSESLLNNTIDLLRAASFLENIEYVDRTLLENYFDNDLYTKSDLVKIRSIIYGAMFNYEILLRHWAGVLKGNEYTFKFNIKNRTIETNDDELLNDIQKSSTHFMVDYFEKIPNPIIQSNTLNKFIRSAAKIDYDNDTNVFDKQVLYLKKIKDHLSQPIEDKPEYPFTKVGVKNKFIEYLSKHVPNPYLDISYLYQMLTSKSLMIKMGHTQFIEWLLQNKHIQDVEYKKMLKYSQLASLKNCENDERLNKFNNTFFPS